MAADPSESTDLLGFAFTCTAFRSKRDSTAEILDSGDVMNRSTTSTTEHEVVQPQQAGSGQEPTNIQRRTVIGGALAALLSVPGRVMAQGNAVPDDSFVVLLKGLYQPVVKGPNLGLSMVDLNDGSYSTTRIYP